MKIASLLARILLGLIFVVFGLNGFLQFIPMGPPPSGLAGQFLGALMNSHYMAVVSAIQIVTGLLLLVNRYVPLALTVLAAMIFNILLFHILMAPAGLPLAIVVAVLWILAAFPLRAIFSGLLQQRY